MMGTFLTYFEILVSLLKIELKYGKSVKTNLQFSYKMATHNNDVKKKHRQSYFLKNMLFL